jgi:hypothetical protein
MMTDGVDRLPKLSRFGLFAPPGLGGFSGRVAPLFRRHSSRSRGAANFASFAPKGHGMRVFGRFGVQWSTSRRFDDAHGGLEGVRFLA